MANDLVAKGNNLPAHVRESQGLGNEEVGVDAMTIPRLKLLQKMNDEVDRHHANYIPGAEDGHIIDSLTQENYGDHVYAINVMFKEEFVVWRKREAGGGWVGSSDTLEGAKAIVAANDKPEDLDVSPTHTHYLLLKDPNTGTLGKPVIFDFSASKLRPSKNWNSQINMKGGDRFSSLWRIGSVSTQNRAGNAFMNLDVKWEGWVTDEDYAIAKAAYDAFKSSV